jgi:hypothetical protein
MKRNQVRKDVVERLQDRLSHARYVSPADAGAMTGYSCSTWRAWAYSGKCASIKTGPAKQARLLIPVSEIDRIMSRGLRPALPLDAPGHAA